jgi:hypothetical protein
VRVGKIHVVLYKLSQVAPSGVPQVFQLAIKSPVRCPWLVAVHRTKLRGTGCNLELTPKAGEHVVVPYKLGDSEETSALGRLVDKLSP